MASLKGTETEKNLMRSFAGESQARTRYTLFATIAKEQGYPNIEQVFTLTANQELAHAKAFFKHLADEFNGTDIEFDAAYPVAFYEESTLENLKAAVKGETHEHVDVYPAFAEVAKNEGFPKVAATFNMIAKVEEQHAKRFAVIATQLEEGTLFKKSAPVAWHCEYCGHIHFGVSAPAVCPICMQKQGWFKVECEDAQ
ncbi:MAG TPA: rubrerythrin family protein [Firmicutes bacterium]|nr:rubrerythrin family protein [Bacillota bacterium]